MTLLRFEDKNTFNGPFSYIVPNESVTVWRQLLKGLPVYNAAAICSGGEVGFFGLLPMVRNRLTLVDHSYESLYYATVKYLLLQEHGWKKAQELFRKGGTLLSKEVEKAINKLPEPLKAVGERQKALDKQQRSDTYYFDYHSSFVRASAQVSDTWSKIPSNLLASCNSKLHQVEFVHGDLTDVADRGPFNLVYVSNALDFNHSDRNGGRLLVKAVEGLVKPGGYVVAAHNPAYARYNNGYNNGYAPLTEKDRKFPENWELVRALDGRASMFWRHSLLRVTEKAA